MRTFQSALDITANNMANVNTTAYKAERGAFQDLLYTQMDVKSGELLTGHGVKMSDVQPVFIQGAFEKKRPAAGLCHYRRRLFRCGKRKRRNPAAVYQDGSFKISVSEEGDFLATRDGYFVLDGDGKRIQLTKKVVKDKDGKEQATNQLDLDGLNKKIGLFTCDNPEGSCIWVITDTVPESFPASGQRLRNRQTAAVSYPERLNCPVPSSLRKW